MHVYCMSLHCRSRMRTVDGLKVDIYIEERTYSIPWEHFCCCCWEGAVTATTACELYDFPLEVTVHILSNRFSYGFAFLVYYSI